MLFRSLLYVLAHLCAPEVGEDSWQSMNWTDLPKTWLDHFKEAIVQILNWQILPALKFSPKELLLSLTVNTTPTPLEVSSSMPTPHDFNTHIAYAAQQQLGNGMGNPGVFQGYPYPNPSLPAPAQWGTGFDGYGLQVIRDP